MSGPKCLHPTWWWVVKDQRYATMEDAARALMNEIEFYVPIAATWDINAPQRTAHSMPSHDDRRPT